MKKIKKKPLLVFRILDLMRKKQHKTVRKFVKKGTIKTYLLAHKTLFKFFEFLLPVLATLIFVMLIFIIAVLMGLTFSSTTNFVIIMVSGTISIFILFYQIFKSIIEDWLKKTNEEKKQLK